MKVEEGRRTALEKRHRAEEEHTRLEAEEEAQIIGEANLKSGEEEYTGQEARLKYEEEEEYLRLKDKEEA